MMHIPINELTEGRTIELPELKLSKREIIRFAKEFDPQPLHTNEKAARKSPFGGIIASGLHPYIAFHKAYWVDMVRDHFICGLGLRGVRFYKPAYPDVPMQARLLVVEVEPKPGKGTVVLHWRMDIFREQVVKLCSVEFTTYHYLSPQN